MGPDRFARRYRGPGRRGVSRAAPALLALAALLATGCGAPGRGAETDPEKGSDVAILNAALATELTSLDVYTRGLPLLRGLLRVAGRQLRAHQQEYLNALSEAIRRLGGEAHAEQEDIDLSGVRGQAAFLARAYELENAALAFYLEAAPRLFGDLPRTLIASLAAAHAQHLVVLRSGLGADLASAVPEAFESGEAAPPDAARRADRG